MKNLVVFIGSIFLAYLPSLTEAMDNLALLSGTLRTFQQAGCDDNVVTLKCPPGTSISVELAQYGKATPHNQLCPPKTTSGDGNLSKTNNSCLWPTALQNKWEEMTQGTWGRTVVEACQKKSNCKFQASPKTFDGDPCPGERKYVEVAYKCRPYEFRSRVACEDDHILLQCNPHSRIAVYSASYGRTEYESFHCPQPQGVVEETCLMSYATETVMKICHGRRMCEFAANTSTFGSPCRPQTRMYLRIVYTCVPQKVLSKQYANDDVFVGEDSNINYEQDDFISLDSAKESASLPPVNNLEGEGKGLQNFSKQKFPLFGNHFKFDGDNLSVQSLYIYLTITIGVSIFLLVVIVGVSIAVRKHRTKKATIEKETKRNSFNLPHGFIDEISEVDDIDLNITSLRTSDDVVGGLTQSTPSLVDNVTDMLRYPYMHSNPYHLSPFNENVCDRNSYYYG